MLPGQLAYRRAVEIGERFLFDGRQADTEVELEILRGEHRLAGGRV
jgi:hypothetical protein